MMPAARIGDMHMCPMVTPGVPPIPHVGGPVSLGCPTVLIGGMPAARMGDMCVCVGPPDSIMMGSPTVLIGGMMAARVMDPTMHGGMITLGCPTVLIGVAGAGGAAPAPGMGMGMGMGIPGMATSASLSPESASTSDPTVSADDGEFPLAPPLPVGGPPQGTPLKNAKQSGAPFCEICQ
ncbi:MAG: putative Zn-binding protein involved in type VI secretion [Planctomycetaceae bacterium]|jgi:uncharacterized Zn-binding protein involved in type VI secretion